MSTIAEIDAAASKLTINEQAELLSRMTERLRAEGKLSEPGDIPMEEIQEWLEEDARQGVEIRKMFGR